MNMFLPRTRQAAQDEAAEDFSGSNESPRVMASEGLPASGTVPFHSPKVRSIVEQLNSQQQLLNLPSVDIWRTMKKPSSVSITLKANRSQRRFR